MQVRIYQDGKGQADAYTCDKSEIAPYNRKEAIVKTLKVTSRGRIEKTMRFLVQMLLVWCILLMPVLSNADRRKEIIYPGKSDDVFYFLHISDTHVGNTCGVIPSSKLNFKYLLSMIRDGDDVPNWTFDPKFIVNTGDLTDGSSLCPTWYHDGWDCVCLPDGPHWEEWKDYADILNEHSNIISKYFDFQEITIAMETKIGMGKQDKMDISIMVFVALCQSLTPMDLNLAILRGSTLGWFLHLLEKGIIYSLR